MDHLQTLFIKDIVVNPYQPRRYFSQKELEELAQSISENGIIQPIVVRPSSVWGYELIAGERRLRASKLAGLDTIPALVKDLSDQASMKQALIENLQRSDLTPLEEAEAFKQVIDRLKLTHDQLATLMGKSRPYISNSLRLLHLPDNIKDSLIHQKISPGHARLLSGMSETEQGYWLDKIQQNHLSVQKLATLLKKETKQKTALKKSSVDPFQNDLEKHLAQSLGRPIQLTKGRLIIPFESEEDLLAIINKLK